MPDAVRVTSPADGTRTSRRVVCPHPGHSVKVRCDHNEFRYLMCEV